MGVSYRFVTFLGFTMPLDFIWMTTKREVRSGRDCGCGLSNGTRFCPECGAEAPKMVTVTDHTIRPELGIDDDDIGNERIVRDLPPGLTIAFYDDMCGNRILLAGEVLSSQSRDGKFHTVRPAPLWHRGTIASVLIDRQIPYDADSFGVHVLVIAN